MLASRIGDPVATTEVESAPKPFEMRYTGDVIEPVPEIDPDDCVHVVPERIQSCVAGFSLNDSLMAPLMPILWIFGPPLGPVIICVLNRSDGVASQSIPPRSTVKSVIS